MSVYLIIGLDIVVSLLLCLLVSLIFRKIGKVRLGLGRTLLIGVLGYVAFIVILAGSILAMVTGNYFVSSPIWLSVLFIGYLVVMAFPVKRLSGADYLKTFLWLSLMFVFQVSVYGYVFLVVLDRVNIEPRVNQRILPEGDGVLTGKVIAYGKPAVGYRLNFNFESGFPREAKTDSEGIFVIRIPRAKYYLHSWSLSPGNGKSIDIEKVVLESGLEESIRKSYPNKICFDLVTNPRTVLPHFYYSQPFTLYGPADRTMLSDTSNAVFSWAKTVDAVSYKFLIGKVVKQDPLLTRSPIRLIGEGTDKDGSEYWAPIDTMFLVQDTTLVASYVLHHLPMAEEQSPRYYWAIIACDSLGYRITESVHNKFFFAKRSENLKLQLSR